MCEALSLIKCSRTSFPHANVNIQLLIRPHTFSNTHRILNTEARIVFSCSPSQLSHFRSNKQTLLLFLARMQKSAFGTGSLDGTSICHEQGHPLKSFWPNKSQCISLVRPLQAKMGLFCLRFSSCEIGPQNNCSTSDKSPYAAMSYTGSAFLLTMGNNPLTLQCDDSYDSTVVAPRFTTHMDNEVFCYQTFSSSFEIFISAMVVAAIIPHFFSSNSNLFLLRYSVQGNTDESKDELFVY